MRTSKNDTTKGQGVGLFSTISARQVSLVKSFLVLFFFTVFVLVIYSNTFTSPFILDDLIRIEENPAIRVSDFSIPQIIKAGFNSSKTRPLAFITFALNHSLHQYDVFGYHILNLSIHILAGFFLYLFIQVTLRTPALKNRYQHTGMIAFFTALIWLVHPVQTQAVTYIVQRMTSMASLFFILSFLFYAYSSLAENNKKKWLWLISSAVAWLLSLGCKQITAVLPLLIFLYEWYFFQDLSKEWFKKSFKYLLGIAAFFILIFLIYTGFSPWEKIQSLHDYARHEFTITQRLLTQFRVIVLYISLILLPLPARLNLDYDFALSQSLINPISTLFSLIAIIGLITLALYLAKKKRLISFCILWFFVNHLIESSILPLAIIFEHRNYLPSMMVCLIPVVLAYRYIRPDWLKVGLLSALVIGLSVWTYQRNRVWENKVTLWTDVVKKSPGKARPHFNLGSAFSGQKEDEQAIPQYQRALEIDPNLAQPHINLGEALERQGKMDEALEHYRTALELKPELPEALNNIGGILSKQGKTEEAIQYFQNALKFRPHYALAHFNLARALVKIGRTEEGIRHYYAAIQFKPDYVAAHNDLGSIYINMGEEQKAIQHYMAALQIDPDLVEVYNNLGIALMQEGKIDAAISQFQKALKLKPGFIMAENNLNRALAIRQRLETEISRIDKLLKDNPENFVLHFQLGNLYFRKGEQDQAIKQYNRALQLNPKFVPALKNLALVTAAKKEYYRALTIFSDILNYEPNDAETHFNIACMYSRLNRVDESIEWLKKAIGKGYTNWESIKKDSDLDNIRKSSAYKQLIQGH
ncbi:MAG: tetratricopeptide repeat protein [Desulfobacterales bacterium]